MKLELKRAIYEENDSLAAVNRERLRSRGIFAVNVLGGPGAGKTTLITRLAERLGKGSVAVIEGDVASDIDTRRLGGLGVASWQIETGGDCHLNAPMIAAMLDRIEAEGGLAGPEWLFIENIGNLVCPAEFVVGEEFKIVVTGVTEGDDKPYKYPFVFAKSAACVLTKQDLEGAVGFDGEFFRAGLDSVAPGIALFPVDGRSGAGVDGLARWLREARSALFSRP